ncbi:CGNR zinc finger domain-containing protein [Tahibacter soli]|uniref:CGNR zinc finger domain-containing protein n=1 Tax=Tahibacter soli TaxID=2983605 RepID=A0A9X3YNJ6_9GAMM|nr:CGNR zinc finger domain-containing protein [Tahibacter soli]MDC8013981.1 CGNR zinc finger domain-containing protein [Tahibacter soli]
MRIEHHDFRTADLVGGDLAADLVNTVTARDTQPRDWLDDYDALVRWARRSERFSARELDALADLAQRHPVKAKAALARTKALREALCTALYALVADRDPEPEALYAIDAARTAAANAAQLVSRARRVRVEWTVERSGLDYVTHVVAAHALALFEHADLERVRVCDGSDCGWVFVDTSKNGRRRWCDMATCGNVAKARRFHAAAKAERDA